MSRTSLLRNAAIALSLVCAAGAGAPALATPPQVGSSASPPRLTTNLAAGWRFRFGDADASATTATFDDQAWQPVTLPHTWNRLGEYATVRSPRTNDARGVGWYRLSMRAPAAAKGERQFLQFDGVGEIAEVWVNGVRVGEHKGAFSRFRFDVTPVWKPGAANLIAVRADNAKPAVGGSTQDVIPLGGDFFIYGGLYRGVSLITTGPTQIDLLDHGGPGVYVHAEDVTAKSARIEVAIGLRNFAPRRRTLTLRTTIADAAGDPVVSMSEPASVEPGAGEAVAQSLTLPFPHLWNGRADPYLYAVTVELRDGAKVLDRVTQPLGVRTFRMDPDQGFFLNGKHLQLHGVSRHQDRPDKGWALSPEDHAEDMALIQDIGANTVRMAHYEHAQEWYDDADKAGMVAWAEIPFVNAASFGDDDGTPALFDNAREQLTELIRQNYNHPSVMMWSVGNEVDIGATFAPGGKPARSLKLLRTLAAQAKQEDPTRPTVFADCCEEPDLPGVKQGQMLAGATDLIGYNRYYGWYYATPAALGDRLDHFHAKHPAIPMSVSEYGAGGALTQHSDNPLGGTVNAFGRPHPEEYQSWYHEESWKALNARPYLFATWVWNMFDFASDLRAEGESIDLNDKGLVTYDRKTKKDAYFFYRAQWSDQPTLHITGSRYVDRAYPTLDVKAYSNADKATLSVNGVALRATPCPDRACVWKNVSLRPGVNTVTATAVIGGQPISDTVTWNAPDAANGIRIKAGALGGLVTASGQRFGSDTFFSGGVAKLLNTPGFSLDRSKTSQPIMVAGDGGLDATYRQGAFSYDVPVPNGAWTVSFHTFEPDAARAATRTFAMSVDGKPALDKFNPATAAGGVLKDVVYTLPVKVVGGRLKLTFTPEGGPALVSAISITK